MSNNAKRRLGIFLHGVATLFYILALLMGIMVFLEWMKALEILYYITDKTIAYGGVREVILTGLAFAVAGKVVNSISKKIYPRLHRGPWSINYDR